VNDAVEPRDPALRPRRGFILSADQKNWDIAGGDLGLKVGDDTGTIAAAELEADKDDFRALRLGPADRLSGVGFEQIYETKPAPCYR